MPGHEIVGRVEAAGEGVGLKLGARVGVAWLGHTDGTCPYCRSGRENLCDAPLFTGFTRDGGYATHTIAEAAFAFPLSDDLDPVAAAPLLCAGLIGWRTLKTAGEGRTIGIYGFGAAAHIIAQVCRWQGRRVFAFTRPGDAAGQAFARSMGAEWAGGSEDKPPAPLDAALLFAPVGALIPSALAAVRKGGRVVCGGIHMSDIPSFPYRLLWEERSVLSVANLTRDDGHEFLALAPQAKVRTTTTPYALDKANEALDDLRHGRLEGAPPRGHRAVSPQSLSTGPAKPASPAPWSRFVPLCLPELRGDHPALARQVRVLRRVEHDHRGSAALGVGAAAVRRGAAGRPFPLEDLAGASRAEPRLITGIAELDRVAGGGFVPGSTTLIGGEPGIGKSTLLIQACAAVARSGGRVVYVSGEESTAQVRLRAARLGLADAPVQLAAQTFVEDIVATLGSGDAPRFVVIDFDSDHVERRDRVGAGDGEPGARLGAGADPLRQGERRGAPPGRPCDQGRPDRRPARVEHMVDAVFSFEGDGAHAFRLLRAAKNRFGATDEVGVFEMTGGGLAEVPNPRRCSSRTGRRANPGAAVFAGVEGARPLLVEIQALVAPTTLGTPRRAVVGWEPSRLAMVLAVLEAHGGMKLGQYDVYLNVAGGLRIVEPAADLAAAAALVSSLTGANLPRDAVYFGEIALSGSVRAVAHPGLRLKEAAKLGFAKAFAPPTPRPDGESVNIAVQPIETVATLVALIAASAVETRAARAAPVRSKVTN